MPAHTGSPAEIRTLLLELRPTALVDTPLPKIHVAVTRSDDGPPPPEPCS